MSREPRDPDADIHDTGELDRIWDALERLAEQVDARVSRGRDHPVDAPSPEDPSPQTGDAPGR